MNDLVLLALLLAAAILLDVTALRFGYDSRDPFREEFEPRQSWIMQDY